MDRNTVIAVVLITGVLVIWMRMLPSPPPPPEDVQDSADFVPLDTEPAFDEAAIEDTVAAVELLREAVIFTVETDRYTARLSDQGATLVGFELKEYMQFDQSSPVQIVDTTGQGALGIEFQSPDGRNLDSRDIVFRALSASHFIDATEAPAELAFEASLGGGSLRLTYIFAPGSFEIGWTVAHRAPSSFQTDDGYEVVWNGAIPFSEDIENRKQEISKVGAYARSGGDVDGISLQRDAAADLTLRGNVDWIGVKNKYFGAVILSDLPAREAELTGDRIGEDDDPAVEVDFRAGLFMGRPGRDPDQFRLYLGPMAYQEIKQYDGVYGMVDYGWDAFEWMTRPLATLVFIPAFSLLSSGIPNYGLVIIVFCILIKLVLFPLTRSSYRSMAKMRELQPKMQEIKEKYANNPEKQQQATIKLYRESGTNPLGACWPMLLQYPIIIALWQFLQQSIAIRQQGFLWAADLSAPDAVLHLPFTVPFYGDFVAGFTVLMGLSMIVQMRLQATPTTGAQQKIFMYVMPVFIFVIFNRLPSGLSLYYFCYNVFSAAQQQLINRSEKAKQAAAPVAKKGKSLKAPPKRTVKGKGRARKGRK